MNRDPVRQLEPLIDRLGAWRGQLIEVVEEITRSPGTLDRHVTTRATLVMQLEYACITFSGAALTVLGKVFGRDVGYQVAYDRATRVVLAPDGVRLVEQLGKTVERLSTIRTLPEPPAIGSGDNRYPPPRAEPGGYGRAGRDTITRASTRGRSGSAGSP